MLNSGAVLQRPALFHLKMHPGQCHIAYLKPPVVTKHLGWLDTFSLMNNRKSSKSKRMTEELLVISCFLCYDLLEFNKEGCSVRFNEFPVIDQIATGKNILSLRKEKGLSVKDLQEYFGFEEPQAIYRWQYGKTLPSVDNLYALSALLDVPMERILVSVPNRNNVINMKKQQDVPAAFGFLCQIHKEIGVNQTDLLFGSGFAHDQYHIGFLCVTDRSVLRSNEGLQVVA